MVKHFLGILVSVFWNEICENVLTCLKRDETGEFRWDKRESWEIRRDKPIISRDLAILVSLVSFNLRQDWQKCACSFKMRQDERDYTVRRTNEDWPPVPATQIPLRCKIFMASGPGANARNKFKSSLITLIWHYPFAWLFFTNLNALFQCSGVTLCSNLLITSTPGANLELCYIPI